MLGKFKTFKNICLFVIMIIMLLPAAIYIGIIIATSFPLIRSIMNQFISKILKPKV